MAAHFANISILIVSFFVDVGLEIIPENWVLLTNMLSNTNEACYANFGNLNPRRNISFSCVFQLHIPFIWIMWTGSVVRR